MRGFSLIELSIVLVILGLLTGGILAGQSLIRAAELRSVSSEYSRYTAAIYSFRDKYFAPPGDITNATKFWGDNNSACADAAVANGTPGTCNGNGDGLIARAAAVSTTGEMFQFWNQLALAGMIEGTYTGIAGPATSVPSGIAGGDSIIGQNVPASKLGRSGWGVASNATVVSGNATNFDGVLGNYMVVGASNPGWMSNESNMKPEEAWNIDTKMDDGKPGVGKITVAWPTCTTAASGADFATANYALTVSTISCRFYAARVF